MDEQKINWFTYENSKLFSIIDLLKNSLENGDQGEWFSNVLYSRNAICFIP